MLKVDLVTRVLVPVPRVGMVEMSAEDAMELLLALDDALLELQGGDANHPSIPNIKRAVCGMFGVTTEALENKSQRENIVIPRHAAMFVIRHCTDNSLESIGMAFNRNHGTVHHAIESFQARIDTDARIKAQVTKLMERFQKAD